MKILLLGTGESGKSTVLKQMIIIHKGGFQLEERYSYRDIIYSNTLQSLVAVLEALPLLGLSLNPDNEAASGIILDADADDVDTTPRMQGLLLRLVADPAINEAMKRTSKFQLNNSAGYFFDNIGRTIKDGYLPTDDDIIRARVRTTGINEHSFPIGKHIWRIFDVGGQRSERRKWIACFENVDVLLFLIALNEYDEQLYEDETVARMQESMTLFSSISNSQWFSKSSMVLFLNKKDLFQEKIVRVPLKESFPDYEGPNSYEPASQFLKEKFSALYTQPRPLYSHFTCSIDTNSVSLVMTAVADTVSRDVISKLL